MNGTVPGTSVPARHQIGLPTKLILCVALLFALWGLLQNVTITNALVSLFFGGVIPGTHIVLSPNSVINIVLGLAALGCLTILVRAALKARDVRRHITHPVKHQTPIEVLLDVPIMKPVVKIPLLATTVQKSLKIKKARGMHARRLPLRAEALLINATVTLLVVPTVMRFSLTRVMRFASLRARAYVRLLGSILQATQAFTGRAYRVAARHSKSISGRIMTSLVTTWYVIQGLTIIAWRLFAPYLWRLDGWLQEQTENFALWSANKIRRHQDLLFIIDTCREMKSIVIEQWHSFRHKSSY